MCTPYQFSHFLTRGDLGSSRRVEPKVKFFSSKNVTNGRRMSKLAQLKRNANGDLGVEPQGTGFHEGLEANTLAAR